MAQLHSSTLCAHHLRQLLTACAESMTFDPSQNIAIPLRMIETFLCPSHFTHSTLHTLLLTHLVQHGGYFRCLRTLLETRVPPPDDDHTHSPLTSSLLEYISRPFKTMLATPLYPSLTRELLSPPLTPHLCHIVIPHLLTLELNFELLVDTLLVSQHDAVPMETLYVVLQLVHPRLHDIDQTSLAKYLKLISLLLNNAPSGGHVTSSDDEDDESMDEDESDPLDGGEGLRKCCISRITSQELAGRLKKET